MNNEPSIIRTEAVSFSVTPQISGDSVLTLSLTPIVKSPIAVESDMLARVDGRRDARRLRLHTRSRGDETKEAGRRRSAALVQPGKVVTVRKQVELVILLTAKIVAGVAAQ